MALNPLAYTEKIVQSFLRYQLTTYPFADDQLNRQMRDLLSLDTARETPLLQGPYISLSRAFRSGASIERLAEEGILQPHMQQLIPFPAVYGHQEEAIRAIASGQTTLISTGTGSGKSECFLYPIISRCLQLRDEDASPGICAVIVYPMNALAEDQLGRLRELLAGTGITFGMYVGKTPNRESEVTGHRMPNGSSRSAFLNKLQEVREQGEGVTVHPAEEVCSREKMRSAGSQPRILLTNVNQLELLLTRQSDVELFDHARLDFMVFDEAHTFTGAQGAETACLIRRLRTFCHRDPDQTVCVATSATIVDAENPDAARDFASRFFGVARDRVATVNEAYERETWAEERFVPDPFSDPVESLRCVLQAVDAEGGSGLTVPSVWKELTGKSLPDGEWDCALYDELTANELLYQAAELLTTPRSLVDLIEELGAAIGRPVCEEEIILWLTLGAAARREGRPLVRPVVHGFIRGVPGAVVTYDDNSSDPVLHLSAEEDSEEDGQRLRLRVSNCTTCGQHYFEHSLSDFQYIERQPGGGQVSGEAVFWEAADEAHGGTRVLFLDHLISTEEEENDEDHPRLARLFMCRQCGAAHREEQARCLSCGSLQPLLPMLAVQQRKERVGYLARCVCCGANGRQVAGRFREPCRPVRATNVADVHVLAQDMVQHAERRRLLIFADNRQDAAFQAGWMRDHARRFRLRTIIARLLEKHRSLSVGDLTHHLDILLDADDALSMALIPEVWSVAHKEAGGAVHRDERRFMLRILVLVEISQSGKQQIGLEPWGRLKIDYLGLNPEDVFIQEWAPRLDLQPEELCNGIAALLDQIRRKRVLSDSIHGIFSRTWNPGDRELESGYLPTMSGVPKGVKFSRDPGDHTRWVDQWLSSRPTAISEIARKWGVREEDREDFMRQMWSYLISPDTSLLVPVVLRGSRGNPLPHCAGTHQINADKILLTVHNGVHRCRTCRRRTVRSTPQNQCLAWQCDGKLEFVDEDSDNYDLQLIDQDYVMLQPREHTAMVPPSERETLEQIFKGDSDIVNTLVCTQTLELGVDIGALDAVLMRNVPPLPANYWQRAGRAGRRHRMAVNLTYCRPVGHDRSYFATPLKMLGGHIDAPSFNLSNDLMIAKHVHATVITVLFQLARPDSALTDIERAEIAHTLRQVFPAIIRDYLFTEEGDLRPGPLDVSGLANIVEKHRSLIQEAVFSVFRQGWPEVDAESVRKEQLDAYIDDMTTQMETVIRRLFRRLRWAHEQMAKLEQIRLKTGTLDTEQLQFYYRCDRLIKRLKGTLPVHHNEAQGIDDTITYSVLAAEGFLPGYGIETGSVIGLAEVPRWVRGMGDFSLPRAPSIALREYVPGNLIYARGQKFVPRRYNRDVREELLLEINPVRQAVRETSGGPSGDPQATTVTSLPVCDVALVHSSRISDEEDNRFQMGVTAIGREIDQHSGGKAYRWGTKEIQLRKGQRLQLVNVGPTSIIRSRSQFGYPICKVCGQSVSPFSSDKQLDDFREKHQEWCGQIPGAIAFHADLSVDVLKISNCTGLEEAYSLAESLRFSATEVLDMHIEDLQVLIVSHPDKDEPDALLYDPMPGGSGLLEQLCWRFSEILQVARRLAESCPSLCGNSCIDCFQTYRNAFYHEHLNRHLMVDRIDEWGHTLNSTHPIPPRQPTPEPAGDHQPVNAAERKLRNMLLAAGFPEGAWQEQRRLALPAPYNTTTPDVTFADPDDDERFIFIYLDGLSAHIHGNPETQETDRQIRAELVAEGHTVISITCVDLDDQQAMTRYFKRLAKELIGREAISQVDSASEEWFEARNEEDSEASQGKEEKVLPFTWVDPNPEEYFRSCLPVFSLKAAATGFSQGQEPEILGWAEVDTTRQLNPNLFVAQVVGKSMEPGIPDGSWCLFNRNVGGSRDGRDLVIQHRDIADSETGGSYTIKRYQRPPQDGTSGELHGKIVLKPLNPDFSPIIIENDLDEIYVVAEFTELLD